MGIAPYAEVVGKGRNFARLPLTRELSSDSETEGEIRLRQHLSRAIFSLSLRLFAAQKSTSLVRGRLAPAARCQNRSIFHLIRFAALSTFFSRNGPLLSAAPTFPPRAGELPQGKVCAATGGNFPVNKLPTYMEAYSTMHKAGSSSRLFPCLSRRGTAVCPFFTLLSLTKRLPEIHRQALCLLTARCTGGRAAA